MRRVPWFVWSSLAAVTCILCGVYWDISWHMTIGRDTFWTPAHLLIQAGGILSGLAGSYLIVSTTRRRAVPAVGIRVWGFRGPLGAFFGVWGAATMVASAPFDNWWHAAYGLDVKILSPPHIVLTTGILGVAVGAALLVIAASNNATGPERARLRTLVLVLGGQILTLAMIGILELTFRANLHRAEAYGAMAIVAPVALFAVAHASGSRWGATVTAASYMGTMLLGMWILPRFGAEPKLGPVYQHITHYIPLEFPPLVIVPAVLIDLARARLAARPRWLQAIVAGVIFVVALVAVEWPFASFLSSEASHGWLFATDYYAYFVQPEWYEPRGELMVDDQLALGLAKAIGLAIVASRVGMLVGDAMAKVRR